MFLHNVSLICFLCSYLVALALELTQFVRRTTAARIGTLLFGVAGFVAHTTYLLGRSQLHDLPPLLSSTYDWMLVSAWLAMALYLGVQLWSPKLSLGIFAIPIVLMLIGVAPFTSRVPIPQVSQMRWWSMLHASLWSIGILGILLACLASLMYLVQHYRLKSKQVELPALHLLSLERLSRINWWLVVVSVPLQTLGMATGLWMIYLSKKGEHPVDLLSSTVVINAVMWVVMALLFGWMLGAKNPTGRLVAFRTILGCLFMVLTLLAMKIGSADIIHGFSSPQQAGGNP